jgi:23S rRNA (cytidine1920-2'-O)/16S rRNA (cytidine1409-2'-O)-methyltransferase
MRERLDQALVRRGLAPTRERARAIVLAGKVTVDGVVVDKAGAAVREDAQIALAEADHPFASRGGVKLAGALDGFGIDVSGRVCLDVGASTGGFTDCLLQRGAAKVYAIDVGRAQLAPKLATDPRVVVVDRVNARALSEKDVPELVSLATIDVSFISAKKVLPAVAKRVAPGADVVVLVKPQFEAGRAEVGKGGVVKDDAVRTAVTDGVASAGRVLGLAEKGRADSVLAGPKGNREVFLWLAQAEPYQATPSQSSSTPF